MRFCPLWFFPIELTGRFGRKIGGSAVPLLLQFSKILAAFILELKIRDMFVSQEQIPFVRVAVLKDSVPGKIVLANGTRQGVNRLADEREGFVHFVKGQMEGFLVAMQVLIVKI